MPHTPTSTGLPARTPGQPAATITDTPAAIVVYWSLGGAVLAQAYRDDETGQWTVTTAPGTADAQTWCVPTKRAAYAIVVDPEMIPILR